MTSAQLVEIERNLERVRPHVEAARRDAKARGRATPDNARGLPTLTIETPNQATRIAAAVRAFGAPAALATEMVNRGLTLRQAHDLLSKAAGSARTVSAAGVDSIRLHLLAMDQATRDSAAQASTDRMQTVGDLLHRYGLVHTMAGMRVAASKHDANTLRALVQARADRFGRICPSSQLALMRDLMLTPVKETTK